MPLRVAAIREVSTGERLILYVTMARVGTLGIQGLVGRNVTKPKCSPRTFKRIREVLVHAASHLLSSIFCISMFL